MIYAQNGLINIKSTGRVKLFLELFINSHMKNHPTNKKKLFSHAYYLFETCICYLFI